MDAINPTPKLGDTK